MVTTVKIFNFLKFIYLFQFLSHFQEDCALENVWNMSGLSILTSAPPMPPYVCFLCASKGQHEVTDNFYSILI